jgi:hypothetical protein
MNRMPECTPGRHELHVQRALHPSRTTDDSRRLKGGDAELLQH